MVGFERGGFTGKELGLMGFGGKVLFYIIETVS